MLCKLKPPYIGAAYYPEMWDQKEVAEDIKKMKDIGLNVMRVGEFSWSSFEPHEGEFHFEQLQYVVEELAKNDIAVIMCTPSATPPKWLTDKYNETLSIDDMGVQRIFGGRCHPCKSSSIMREKNRIITEKLCEAFSDAPNVIGWQLDNELYPYGDGCFCPTCQKKFHNFLAARYKTIDQLNEAWGTCRWSLSYESFDDVIPPRRDTWNHPSLSKEWLEFQVVNHAEYIEEQAAVIRKYTDKPIGTDLTPSLIQSYQITNKNLDLVMFNHYEGAADIDYPFMWFDYIRQVKDRPFWVTETEANWSGSLFAERGYRGPGSCYLNTWAPFICGGEANLFWLFRTHPQGHEMGHGAIITSAGRYHYTTYEIKRASAEIQRIYPLISQEKFSNKIAIHFSHTAAMCLKYAPVCKDLNYESLIFQKYYKPLRSYGADLIDTEAKIDDYRVIISPFLTNMTQFGLKDKIIKWVEKGGVWIVGPYSDCMTDYCKKYTESPNSFIEDLGGVYTKIQMPITEAKISGITVEDEKNVNLTTVFDAFELSGAKGVIKYTSGYQKDLYAVTEKSVGLGKIIMCGSVLDEQTLKKLVPEKPICSASDNIMFIKKGKYIIAAEVENKTGTINNEDKVYDLISQVTFTENITLEPYQIVILERIVE